MIINISLIPGSSKNEIIGELGDPPRLKIKITARPIDNQANKALIAFLAKKLKVPKSEIKILKGMTRHQKEVLIGQQSRETEILAKEHWRCIHNPDNESN